jgi:nitrogen regulatory protein PII
MVFLYDIYPTNRKYHGDYDCQKGDSVCGKIYYQFSYACTSDKGCELILFIICLERAQAHVLPEQMPQHHRSIHYYFLNLEIEWLADVTYCKSFVFWYILALTGLVRLYMTTHLKYQIEESLYMPGQSTEIEKEFKIPKKNVNMKRVEAFILSEKTNSVLSTLETLNLQATFYGSKGMGKGEKYMISYGMGAGTTKTSYSNRSTVVTIVEESGVDRVVSAIKESAKTGNQNAGIIVVSSVENIFTI